MLIGVLPKRWRRKCYKISWCVCVFVFFFFGGGVGKILPTSFPGSLSPSLDLSPEEERPWEWGCVSSLLPWSIQILAGNYVQIVSRAAKSLKLLLSKRGSFPSNQNAENFKTGKWCWTFLEEYSGACWFSKNEPVNQKFREKYHSNENSLAKTSENLDIPRDLVLFSGNSERCMYYTCMCCF